MSDEIIFNETETISNSSGVWKLLIVDDEAEIHEVTKLSLSELVLDGKKLQIISAFSGSEALKAFREHHDIALAMIDIVMERDDAGLELVKSIRNELNNSDVRIIIRTGQPGIAPERQIIENYDINDYKEKSELTFGKLYSCVYTALKNYRNILELITLTETLRKANQHLSRENIFLKKEVHKLASPVSILGSSAAWRKTLELINSIKESSSNVFLQGETGTGKEMIARYIHFSGRMNETVFITINCAALSEHLLESELFGHKKGAFTGADYDRKGLFEEADGGTMFLDEIGDMPLETQAKVLRAIQFGEIKRIGENKTRNVKVRVISATNKDISSMLNDGTFRKDLYYRLAVFHVIIPSLNERAEDIPLLANHFLNKMTNGTKSFDPQVLEALSLENYPGNVRELESKVERMVNLAQRKETIDIGTYKFSKKLEGRRPDSSASPINLPTLSFNSSFSHKELIQEFEFSILNRALDMCNGSKIEAAKLLKMPERTFFNKYSTLSSRLSCK